MISFNEANLAEISVHHIGNKAEDEYMTISDQSNIIGDENLSQLLFHFFLNPIMKSNEVYRLSSANDSLNDNEIFKLVSAVFDGQLPFHEMSKTVATQLYNLGNNTKNKAGDLYVAYFENLQLEGELHDAIGIFKSETKESYLKITPLNGGFDFQYEKEGINLSKLDKSCIILNTDREEGYKVMAVEQAKSSGSSMWKDEFLKLKIRNDNFTQTKAIMEVYKTFVTEKLDEEYDVERTDKIDLLNRSMKYFKEKDSFDMQEFSNEVIANEEGIALFKSYKENYEEEFDMPIADTFDIAEVAVKKQAKDFKSILKLDKNFHVYIHGSKDMIVKEYDEDKGMNCYKLYFKEEN